MMMRDPKTKGWVEIHIEQCKGCGLCMEVCPAKCLELSDDLNRMGYHPIRYKGDGCRADGLCFYACPEPAAITVWKGNPDEAEK